MPQVAANSTGAEAELSAEDLRFLQEAAEYLERPTFLIRVANLVGKPAEGMLQLLPHSAQKMIGEATQNALTTALGWAVRSLPDPQQPRREIAVLSAAARRWDQHLHTAVAATTGAVGGLFGIAGMSVEVPATTTVMLRSIARIAVQSGADLSDPLTRLHCLSVFSLGSTSLDKMDSAYLTARLGLSLVLRDAALFFAKSTAAEVGTALTKGTVPVLVRLINQIAARFQVTLSQKAAAQAVPVAGAAMGALINAAFTDHFNRVARFHFGIVRLEKRYGKDAVQAAYRQACDNLRALRTLGQRKPAD